MSRARVSYRHNQSLHQFELTERPMLVGRDRGCDITIDDRSISRRHAIFEPQTDGSWVLQDVGSYNGLRTDQGRVERVELNDSQRIHLGRVELHFEPIDLAPPPVMESGEPDSTVTGSVDIGELRASLGVQAGVRHETPPSTRAGATPTSQLLSREAAPWAIPLVTQAAEALISSTNLPSLFSNVIDLVFGHLPADRVCVVLFDDSTPDGQTQRDKLLVKRLRNDHERNFEISRSVVRLAVEQQQAVLIPDCWSDITFSTQDSIVANRIRSVICAPICSEARVHGVIYVDTQRRRNAFNDQHLQVLATLAILTAVAVQQTSLRDRVREEQDRRERIERYVPPQVVDAVLESGNAPGEFLGGSEVEASVLFLDLVGFTSFSEHRTPREVTDLLNRVFGELSEVILDKRNLGTLDKFLGDGLMAIFGAPLVAEDHAVRAVRTGLEIQQRLAGFGRPGDPKLEARVGINSGLVVAGDVGSPRRKDFTVIGDTVNIASRLEHQIARPGQVIVGARTYELAQEHFDFEAVGEVSVRGREGDVAAYLARGPRDA